MINRDEITTYQRQSNAAAGYCTACTVKLHPFETHVCGTCAIQMLDEASVETGPQGVMHDEEAEKAVQES